MTPPRSDEADNAVYSQPPEVAPINLGPFEVKRDWDRLVLSCPNQGELGWQGCAMFAMILLSLLVIGVLAITVKANETTSASLNDASTLVAPTQNHFGFLWLVGSLGLLVAIPLYAWKAYQAALTYTFDRTTGMFLHNRTPICSLRRIEFLCIRETKDVDDTYLYLLQLVYNDGYEMMLHNGYEEREIMNLANEIALFTEKPVRYKQGERN